MNRRGFIATLTAFAGVVLAKIKAPAASQGHLYATYTGDFRPGIATLAPEQPITGVIESPGRLRVFTKSHVYVYSQTSDGMWRWMKTDDTCPDCGHEIHEGYDLLCMTPNCTRCVNGQCLRYTNR